MGYRMPIDTNSIKHQIWIAGVEIRSPRLDGFTAWEIKRQLYEIQSLLDGVLGDSPVFAPEAEYLAERERLKIVDILEK